MIIFTAQISFFSEKNDKEKEKFHLPAHKWEWSCCYSSWFERNGIASVGVWTKILCLFKVKINQPMKYGFGYQCISHIIQCFNIDLLKQWQLNDI